MSRLVVQRIERLPSEREVEEILAGSYQRYQTGCRYTQLSAQRESDTLKFKWTDVLHTQGYPITLENFFLKKQSFITASLKIPSNNFKCHYWTIIRRSLDQMSRCPILSYLKSIAIYLTEA